MQVAKATAGWLKGVHDPFEDINMVLASAAEQSLGPKPKKKVTVCSLDGFVTCSVKSCTWHCMLSQRKLRRPFTAFKAIQDLCT